MDGYPLSHFNGKPYPSTYYGTPEGTRTPNPRNRNPMLYPLSHRRIFNPVSAGSTAEYQTMQLHSLLFQRLFQRKKGNNPNRSSVDRGSDYPFLVRRKGLEPPTY